MSEINREERVVSASVDVIGKLSREELEDAFRELKDEHRKLRINIRAVARRYGQQHSLCAVVEQALEEAGLNSEMKQVVVKGHVPFQLTVRVDTEVFDGLSDEEKIELLNGQNIVSANLSLNNPTGQTHDRNRFPNFDPSTARVIPHQAHFEEFLDEEQVADQPYVLRASSDGRVAHYFAEPELADPRQYVTSKCSRYSNYARNLFDPVNSRAFTSRVQRNQDGSPKICKQCDR